jgi:hypothetical protein
VASLRFLVLRLCPSRGCCLSGENNPLSDAARIRSTGTRGDFDRACQRLRIAAEKTHHSFRRFQIAIGVALAPEAGVVDGAIVPNASDDILQNAPRRPD